MEKPGKGELRSVFRSQKFCAVFSSSLGPTCLALRTVAQLSASGDTLGEGLVVNLTVLVDSSCHPF